MLALSKKYAATEEAQAASHAISQFQPLGQAKLTQTLERLEATAADAISRWSCADDFGKVDLVVSKLLSEGNTDAALLYVCKVLSLCVPQVGH
jgi:hypothetical protein